MGGSAVCKNGPVGGPAVIGTVGCELTNLTVCLIEQWLHLRRIIGVLVGQCFCDYVTVTGVHRPVEFAPVAPRSGAVPVFQPLASTVYFQPGAVDPYMDWPVRHRRQSSGSSFPPLGPAAQGCMIRDRQVQSQKIKYRPYEPRGLAKGQAEYASQCQGCFNGKIGIPPLAATDSPPGRMPSGQCFRRYP